MPNGDYPDDDEGATKAFVAILLFDKDYNLVDAAWEQITTVGLQSSPAAKQSPHDYLFKEVTVREPGFAYVFVSNEHPTFVDAYFACPATGESDVTTTHAPSSLLWLPRLRDGKDNFFINVLSALHPVIFRAL